MQTSRDAFFKTIGVLAAISSVGLVVAALVLWVLPTVGLPVTNADRREQQAERDGEIVARCTDAYIRQAPRGTTVAVTRDGHDVKVLTGRQNRAAPAGLPDGRNYIYMGRPVPYNLAATCPLAPG